MQSSLSKRTITTLLFLSLFLSSCTSEYWQFHASKKVVKEQKQTNTRLLKDFSLSQIEDRDVEILTTPDKQVLERIVSMIVQSKKQVYIESYILTEKRIIQSLKDAKKR
jgi:phosphatidylserine/phosphatidylglycerophosphate/cardiolipin synthase-like enzyme